MRGAAPSRGSSSAGFTLIEVIAAIFLTSIVLSVAIGFFVNLSRSTEAATNRTREGRHAVAALDRIARDLEGAYLVMSPEGEDPFYHSWQFLAENRFDPDGADRVKFVTRNHRPRNPRDHGSDIAVVTYLLREGYDEPGYELVRAVEPGLPEAFDRSFRADDDELFMVVAERIGRFSMRFLNRENLGSDWQPSWDSSRIEEANLLPAAVELRLSYLGLYDDDDGGFREDFDEGFDDSFGDEDDEGVFVRQVILPMRAFDLDALLEEVEEESAQGPDDEEDEDGDGEDGEDGDARTVGECLHPDDQQDVVNRFGDVLNTELTDDLKATLERAGYRCK